MSRFAMAALALLLAACGPAPVPNEPVGEAPPPPARPSDGLLADPELQEVVDLQVARDGEALTALLRAERAAVRARAAYALASVQEPGAGSALTGLLSDPDPHVRRDAAFALGQLLDPLYGPALLGALRDEENPEVRWRLLEAVGKAGDLRVLEALLGLEVAPEEEAVRKLAVSRLGIRGFTLPTAISHLLEALKDEDLDVRRNAAYYFGRSEVTTPWAESATTVRGVLDSLPASDPTAMHLLVAMGLLGDGADNPRFLWWLETSPDWRIRTNAAVSTTGRTTDPRIREGLLDALDEPSTHVATAAADGLTRVQRPTPAEQEDLEAWVRDHPREWRRAGPILAVLGRFGKGEAINDWLSTWSQEDVIPRTRGIGALAFVPTPEATAQLMELAASSQSRIRGTALGALARRWRAERRNPASLTPYFEVFRAGLETGDPAAVFPAAPALADSAFLPLGSLELLMTEYEKLSLPDDLESMQAIRRAISTITGEEYEPLTLLDQEEPVVDWAALAALGPRPKLILETEKGTVTLVLDAESAPLTVQTIAGFAQDGLYDGTPFHRVVPNFVIQGGDFTRRDGFGGPGFSIRSEFTQTPFRRGVLGMASAGKDTEGSQFFITHSMAPHLDGGYTAFGWVELGMDVVDQLYVEDVVVTARVEPDRS
jgi:peptidylprolyl isomerase